MENVGAWLCLATVFGGPLLSIRFFLVRGVRRGGFELLAPRKSYAFGTVTWAIPSRRGALVAMALPAAFFVFGVASCASAFGMATLHGLLFGPSTVSSLGDAPIHAIWLLPLFLVLWLLTRPSARRTHIRRLHLTQAHLAMDDVACSFDVTDDDIAQPLSPRPIFQVPWEEVDQVLSDREDVAVHTGATIHRYGPVTSEAAAQIVEEATSRMAGVPPRDDEHERGRLESLRRQAAPPGREPGL